MNTKRDLHGLCNRLAEVFNEDDTPDELSTEAREAIEKLWEERDQLRAALQEALCPDCTSDDTSDPESDGGCDWCRNRRALVSPRPPGEVR